ncbi:MAG: nucleotidyltransferase domain-containing protein [Candidatus Roizmanbacteria bacterium]|nr:nucleotidyltransferase domain-containing protein [Candidatus Roizmanbacteria bacterium]
MDSKMLKQIELIGKSHNLDFIILHGSKVTGRSINPESDTDIAISRKGGFETSEYTKLHSKFLELFGDEIDFKTLHRKNPLFLFEVIKDGQLLYGDEACYNDFIINILNRYRDIKPLLDLREKCLEKKNIQLQQLYA